MPNSLNGSWPTNNSRKSTGSLVLHPSKVLKKPPFPTFTILSFMRLEIFTCSHPFKPILDSLSSAFGFKGLYWLSTFLALCHKTPMSLVTKKKKKKRWFALEFYFSPSLKLSWNFSFHANNWLCFIYSLIRLWEHKHK